MDRLPTSAEEDATFEALQTAQFKTVDRGRKTKGILFRTTLLESFLSSPAACRATIEERLKHDKLRPKDGAEEVDADAHHDREVLHGLVKAMDGFPRELDYSAAMSPRSYRVVTALTPLVFVLPLACAPAAPAAPEPRPGATAAPTTEAPSVHRVDAPTEAKTPTGARYTVPKGWYVTELDGATLLEDPDRELKMWLVDVRGRELEHAIERAWKKVRPGFALDVDDRTSPPSDKGWDEVMKIDYVTPVEEDRVVFAVASRMEENTYVLLLDAPRPALGRRGAQVMQIHGGLRAPGHEEESFAGREPHALDDARLAKLDSFARSALHDVGVPGAAVAVVQNGAVVFEKGYGVRRLVDDEAGSGGPTEEAKPVTPDTAFMIGSTTKSLTSLMMARLVDEGLYDWSTPVTKVFSNFRLGDPEATKRITMRHTMCACTGLPRQDMEFIFAYDGVTPTQRFEELATMKPTTGFGEIFQYSNGLVSAGGYVAAHAAFPERDLLEAYVEAMRTRLFEPLGMTRTTFDMKKATRNEHATPHGFVLAADERPAYRAVPVEIERAVVSVAPAGGAWSTVGDLARAMLVELGGGEAPDGARIVSETNLLERHEAGVKINDDTSYGLGLIISNDRDITKVGHGGNTLGFSCQWSFYPEHGLGIVVLANAQSAVAFTNTLRRRLLELVFDGEPQAEERLSYAVGRRREKTELELGKVEDDEAWARAVAGRYRNDALGELDIRAEDGRVMVDAGEWRAPARRKVHEDGTATLLFVGPPLAGVELIPKDDDLLLRVSQQRYVFEQTGSGAE